MLTNLINLLKLTNKKSKKRLIFLIILLFILTMLETIGVGIIIPIIALVLDEELLNNYPLGIQYYNFVKDAVFLFSFDSFREKIIIVSIIFTLLFFFIKFLFIIFVTYFQQYFLFNLHGEISSRLIKSFVDRDINFHIKKNSSELLSDLIEEINEVISIYASYIMLFTEALILILISSLVLSTIKFNGIIVILIFLFFGLMILSFTKAKLVNLGKKRQFHFVERFNSAKDTFNLIKEIKLFNVQSFFINKFNYHNNKLNLTAIPKKLYIVLPRIFLEIIAVATIFLIIILLVVNNKSSEEIIFILGLISAASIKIFPSVSKIVISGQTVKFGDVAIKKIFNELKPVNKNFNENKNLPLIDFENQISVNIQKFQYPNSEKYILNNTNIFIKKNQFVGIFGESGVGKSTLADIIMGLQILDQDKNKFLVDNKSIYPSINLWRKKFGYVGQSIHFLNDTIEKNISFGEEENKIDKKLILESIKKAELSEFVNQLPNKTKSILGESGLNISGGQQQRIAIARAYYQSPEILVFDEATSSLDENNEKEILKTIYSYKGTKTVILISHKKDNLKNCDKIFYI